MYKAYRVDERPVILDKEEIITYNQAGQIINLVTMGLEDDAKQVYDTMIIMGNNGNDSMIVSSRSMADYTKVASREVMTYNNLLMATNTTTTYTIVNNKLDSTLETSTYQYLPMQKVIKTTTSKTGTTTKQYVQDANGIKIFERYNYKLDKANRLIEKYAKSENKKTAQIEKYTYYPNGKRKEFKIMQGKKLISITTYLYNVQEQIVLEKTKNIIGKKATYDTITYEYTNGLPTKEITHVYKAIDTIVTYSCESF
jgi:hypothetical protein